MTGVAELPPDGTGQNFVVALGGFLDLATSSDVRLRFEAGTFMHELGHNLGLQHGGGLFGFGDDTNYKPNYLSVMNYYNQGGILQADAVGSEQIKSCTRDKDCGPAALCTQSPGGAFNGVPYPVKFCTRYDYSDQLLPAGGPTPGVLNTTGTGLTVDLDFIWWENVLGINACPSGRYVPLRGNSDWGDLLALQEDPHTDHSWKTNPEPHRDHELTIEEAKERHILHLPRQLTIMAASSCSLASAVAAKSSDITLWLPGTDDLDVSEIDLDSLKLHGATPASVNIVDVNGDGRPDLELIFPAASLKLHPNAKRMTLTGSLKNSQAFWGHVEVGCQESFRIER